MESIFQPYGFLSLRFVSTKKDDYVEVVFDRMNNILAAFREVNDKRRFGIVVTMPGMPEKAKPSRPWSGLDSTNP